MDLIVVKLLIVLGCIALARGGTQSREEEEEENQRQRRRPFAKRSQKWGVQETNRTSAFELVSEWGMIVLCALCLRLDGWNDVHNSINSDS